MIFALRMAAEMTRRVEDICAHAFKGRISMPANSIEWSGTFHAIGAKLLRLHAETIGLDPSFSILDRGDAEDLMDVVREGLELSDTKSRFPKQATCLEIYSYTVNAQATLRANADGQVAVVRQLGNRLESAIRRLCRSETGPGRARLR
jgi:DNA helicase-2/ATP-dependent DNA helicase PcrA